MGVPIRLGSAIAVAGAGLATALSVTGATPAFANTAAVTVPGTVGGEGIVAF